jgi:hypothetical protein
MRGGRSFKGFFEAMRGLESSQIRVLSDFGCVSISWESTKPAKIRTLKEVIPRFRKI